MALPESRQTESWALWQPEAIRPSTFFPNVFGLHLPETEDFPREKKAQMEKTDSVCHYENNLGSAIQ
jgi:hypothetical protein